MQYATRDDGALDPLLEGAAPSSSITDPIAGVDGVPLLDAGLRPADGSPPDTSALLPWIDDIGPAANEQAAAPSGLHVSLKDREIVAGNPDDPNGGFFVASQAEKGARWRTSGGGFSGTLNNKGLDAQGRLGAHDDLHAKIGTDRAGTLAWEHDGKNEGELYGRYGGSNDYEAGLRRTWDLDGGAHLTGGLRHQQTASGAIDGGFASYKSGDGHTTVDGSAGVQGGHFAGSLSGSHALGAHDTVTGSLTHDATGTVGRLGDTHTWDGGSLRTGLEVANRPAGNTESLTAAYQDHGTHLDGSLVHAPDHDAASLSGSRVVSPQLTLSGHAGYEQHAGGGHQATLGVGERYRAPNLVHGLDLNAGAGDRDFLSATGSIDGRLGRNLYGGAWSTMNVEGGKHTTAQLGGSLTMMANDKTGLTAAGAVDEHGRLQSRLQLDLFKQQIESAGDLADHRKDARLSLYLQYATGGEHGAMDDRLGGPQVSTGNEVSLGARLKF